MPSPISLAANKWLARNQNRMIECPNQPGNLVISKDACEKRYQASIADQPKFYSEDFFNYSFRRGLSVCRDCRIGKKLARGSKAN